MKGKSIYGKVLVPLDGSKLAEAALKEALPMAELGGAEVTLLQVIEPIGDLVGAGVPAIYLEDLLASRKKKALSYLRSVTRRPPCRGLKFRVAMAIGSPAEQIIRYAAAKRIDLIIMSTHGRSGIRRWAFGSVADKVVRGAPQPVLLVRPLPGKRGFPK